MEAVLVDSSILIGVARGEKEADLALKRIAGRQQVICDVVLCELLDGARNQAEHERMFRYFTTTFEVLPFTLEVSLKFRDILANASK